MSPIAYARKLVPIEAENHSGIRISIAQIYAALFQKRLYLVVTDSNFCHLFHSLSLAQNRPENAATRPERATSPG
jgi:hypothetical protein